jgi:hypothetical protein
MSSAFFVRRSQHGTSLVGILFSALGILSVGGEDATGWLGVTSARHPLATARLVCPETTSQGSLARFAPTPGSSRACHRTPCSAGRCSQILTRLEEPDGEVARARGRGVAPLIHPHRQVPVLVLARHPAQVSHHHPVGWAFPVAILSNFKGGFYDGRRAAANRPTALVFLVYLLYSTLTARRAWRRGAMLGRAMAANAVLLSMRSVRLVLARSVTTTLAPAAAHSFLSLHCTWKQAPQPTPAWYSVGLAATRNPTLKEAASVPYPQEPLHACHRNSK